MPHLIIESPLGPLTLTGDGGAIVSLTFGADVPALAADTRAPGAPRDALDAAAHQLGEYFRGNRQLFDLPLALTGSDFSRRVWQALSEIPYGTTTTYGRLAAEIASETGRVVGARAVASAVARTPVPIIVPCHRVVGSDGGLRGYIGGLPRKRALLRLEAERTAADTPPVTSSSRPRRLSPPPASRGRAADGGPRPAVDGGGVALR